jgi:hypothetical protein
MPRRLMPRNPSLPAWAVWVLVLALLNPLCCYLMPDFQADPYQEKLSYSETHCDCAGKPEAVFGAALVLSMCLSVESSASSGVITPPKDLLLAHRLPGGDPPSLAPPLRILFRVFRI